MDWLIDIIQEWALEQGWMTDSYIDRGDPADPDFDQGDLTMDGATYTLDLSGIVPAGAAAVNLFVRVRDGAVNRWIFFRKKSNVNWFNRASQRTQVALIVAEGDTVIALDSNRHIEYKTDGAAIATIALTVKGWWL